MQPQHLQPPSLQIGNYSLLYKIDSGCFADVYMGMNDLINLPVAIKVINKTNVKTGKDSERVMRETSIMKTISHQYIIELFEIIEDDTNVYFVMELASGGSLKSLIVPGQPLGEDLARHLFRQLIVALGYLHTALNVMHRDLKAENILLDTNMHIRLIDFGLSNTFQPGVQQTACGSPAYAAPEVVGRELYSKSADVWSAGVLLYYMSTGEFPFYDKSIPKLLSKIMSDPVDIPVFLSSELKDLINQLLQKDPNKRLPIEDILFHPWVTGSFGVAHQKLTEKEKIRLFRSRLNEDSLDLEIMNDLIKAGVDVSSLKEDLINKSFNSLTAMYRIKRRAKFNMECDDNNENDLFDTSVKMLKFFSCPVQHTRAIDTPTLNAPTLNSTSNSPSTSQAACKPNQRIRIEKCRSNHIHIGMGNQQLLTTANTVRKARQGRPLPPLKHNTLMCGKKNYALT